MARELPIQNGRLTTDLDANGHKIKNLPPDSGFSQAQADWSQTDTTAPDYIKNKPSIPSPVTVDAALSPTSLNPVQNKAVKAALDGKRGVLDLAVYEDGFTEWEFSDGVTREVVVGYDLDAATQASHPETPWYVYAEGAYGPPNTWFATEDEAETCLSFEYSVEIPGSGDVEIYTATRSSAVVPTEDALARASQLARLMPKYAFSAVETISSAGTELLPNEVTPVDAQNKRVSVEAANAYIAVALPAASANGHIRDMMLTLDCSALTDGQEPNVVWAAGYDLFEGGSASGIAPRAGAVNLYRMTEYKDGHFVVRTMDNALLNGIESALAAINGTTQSGNGGSGT